MDNKQDIMGWVKVVVFLVLTQTHFVHGFSWRGGQRANSERDGLTNTETTGGTLSQLLGSRSRLPSPYEVALNELRELESEPLCHRTAARLLVNNCQLLEDKNDATVLTDSGRKIRDFVDSYAASLAICDLERGSFRIPEECENFRESVLNQLPLQNSGHLHNTWVSYRHKALRFCEAARAENEKDQHLLLFQRLANTMGKFSDGLDKEYEGRMNDLDLRAQATGSRIDELSPKIDQLKDGMKSVEDLFLGSLARSLKETADAVNSGAENALNLQRMLEVMLNTALEGQAKMASAHDQSLQLVNQRAESVVEVAMKVTAAVTESATQLRSQIEFSRLRAVELEYRQENLEQGMQRLINITEDLATKYDDHTSFLHQAQNITNEIFDTLEGTAASAAYVSSSLAKESSASSWWPYIWCPAASLVLGSYGLPPSVTRNLALFALGEIAGFTYSSAQSLYQDLSTIPIMKLSAFSYGWGNLSPIPTARPMTTNEPGSL
ncbi:hypothetical protein F4677DRAFT_462984 [Hypoxylon crocopeplum]|nr:hypothetical protein F4677DRAFT_462984 [Hypoxylon crocopeplum]